MTREKTTNTLKKYRIDIIVIASILLISIAIFAVMTFTMVEGSYAEVSVDGNIIGKYPLFLDGTYELNGGTNTLTIENGVARMTYSNCPDHTCENTGKISYVGQTIICLPNHLTITIVGESDASIDFIS